MDEDEGAAEAEADATTPLISAACAGPEGAVRLDDLPSWPTAEATSSASGEIPEGEEEDEGEKASEGTSASRHSTAARNPSPLP